MSDNPFLLPGAGRRGEQPTPSPAPAPTPSPVTTPVQAPTPPADSPVAEETRFDPLPVPPPTRWRIVLPDGTTRPLTGTLVLGRDPAPAAEYPGAELVAVDDPGRSVSKTHAALIARDGRVLACDLHSTNGTVVTTGHRRLRLEPDREAPVPAGSSVELGSYLIRIEPVSS